MIIRMHSMMMWIRAEMSKRMTTAGIITLILLSSILLAQKAVKPIPDNNSLPKDSIFIKINRFDTTDKFISAFLMNTTDSIIKLSGYNNRINFSWQAKRRKGSWINIGKYNGIVCGTGYGSFNIPPDSYTSKRIIRNKYEGSFETDVRLYYAMNKDTFYSAQIPYLIDTIYFLTPSNQILRRIFFKLREGNLPEEKRDELQLKRVEILIAEHRLSEAKEILDMLDGRSVIQYDVAYHSASIRSLILKQRTEDLSDEEICSEVEKIARLYGSIPNHHERGKSAKRVREAYKGYIKNNCHGEEK